MTRLAVVVATAGGAGYAPVAPGTVGSAIGVLLFVFAVGSWSAAWQLATLLGLAAVGVWASELTARACARKDPAHVVIDEVAGQLLTLAAMPASWTGLIAGFVLFRVFDIVKPWPARRLEALPGGLGIMADDLMAGLYGHLALRALLYVSS